ncbi:cobalamin-binding protein [Pseudomonas indica]|jgi:vitamin B12 transport system substrate-binding protein|uniref:cobalamin-binding protein n=1 Tax=Pseudomonas indica TaxID=137658 RepID=UPI000BAB825C|nr:cobalamin-binding protein [Pseudomonas indica]PAU62444.1 cobalamin-binding protein [Pseudomonas indica]
MRAVLFVLCWLALPVQAAERVVSLAPSLSELMLELEAGDLLVGVLDGGERPPALADKPSVGRYGQLEMERLLRLRPDLILLWPDSIGPGQRDQLRQLGIPLYEAEPHRLADLADQAAELGERIGRGKRARQVTTAFRSRLIALQQRYRRERPLTVFYQIWDQPLYTVGGRQIISDALRVCGAENVFADLQQPAPQISVEAVLARNPQVILASEAKLIDGWKAWPQLDAVRHGQVWAVPDRGLERPSLQMLEATARLCELLEQAR